MKVMIMAGGTGGHVYPALAVAEELRLRGHQLVWLGAPDSFEARVVVPRGIAMEYLRVSGLRGKGWARWLAAPLALVRSMIEAWAALRRQRPDVVLGMGGFVAGPGGLVARLLGIPLVIHEQNAVPGLTNRVLARLTRHVLEAFPGAFPKARAVGNPVRAELCALPPPANRMSAAASAPRLLVIGGSQGARALNEVVPRALALMQPARRPRVTHQAGRTLQLAQAAYADAGVSAQVVAFIDDMAGAYAHADLIVCRSGASTVAELSAVGCAAILVPYPHAVDDHQTANARYLADAGAGRLVAEFMLTPERLADELIALLSDGAGRLRMAERARQLAWPTAAADIAEAVIAAGVRR